MAMVMGIKKDTLEKIALIAMENTNISRDRLAELAEVSSMTVGKAVPFLVGSCIRRVMPQDVSAMLISQRTSFGSFLL